MDVCVSSEHRNRFLEIRRLEFSFRAVLLVCRGGKEGFYRLRSVNSSSCLPLRSSWIMSLVGFWLEAWTRVNKVIGCSRDNLQYRLSVIRSKMGTEKPSSDITWQSPMKSTGDIKRTFSSPAFDRVTQKNARETAEGEASHLI
jgi:hypothetical protein